MLFEWDDAKDKKNQEKHNISFEEASYIFTGIVFTKTDDRFDYGETREISIGSLNNLAIVVVVHTDRDGTIRIISARPANKAEREDYYGHCQKVLEGH